MKARVDHGGATVQILGLFLFAFRQAPISVRQYVRGIMMAFNFVGQRMALHALLLSCGLLAGTSAMAQDLSLPADPVAAIEGDWNGIWQDWSVTVTNGRVVLTKGDPKTYSWLPVGTVLGVLNNDGKSEGRLFRFSGSTCLDFPRDKAPSEYQTIPCGDFGAVLTVYADAYELTVSGLSLRRSKNAIAKEQSSRKDTASKGRPPTGKALEAEAPAAQSKYIEVPGPNGMIRLSPEVAARNRAAQEEYERKLEEHADAVAKAKAENERRATQHAESMARAAAEKQEYERKLAANATQVDAQKAQTGGPIGGNEGTGQATRGAKGWMYCDARGAPGDKRRYYSRVTEVDYVPGEITIIDVMARHRPAFKSYVASAHSIYFATDSLLHCPYSTTSLADAEALMARDKRGDGNNGIEIIQTGWVPTN